MHVRAPASSCTLPTITPSLFLFKCRYVPMPCCALLSVDSSTRPAPGEERWVGLHVSLPRSFSASPLLFIQYIILPAQPITVSCHWGEETWVGGRRETWQWRKNRWVCVGHKKLPLTQTLWAPLSVEGTAEGSWFYQAPNVDGTHRRVHMSSLHV